MASSTDSRAEMLCRYVELMGLELVITDITQEMWDEGAVSTDFAGLLDLDDYDGGRDAAPNLWSDSDEAPYETHPGYEIAQSNARALAAEIFARMATDEFRAYILERAARYARYARNDVPLVTP